jgi:hypothetical protein
MEMKSRKRIMTGIWKTEEKKMMEMRKRET